MVIFKSLHDLPILPAWKTQLPLPCGALTLRAQRKLDDFHRFFWSRLEAPPLRRVKHDVHGLRDRWVIGRDPDLYLPLGPHHWLHPVRMPSSPVSATPPGAEPAPQMRVCASAKSSSPERDTPPAENARAVPCARGSRL